MRTFTNSVSSERPVNSLRERAARRRPLFRQPSRTRPGKTSEDGGRWISRDLGPRREYTNGSMRWLKGGLSFECQPDCGQCCTQSVFGKGEVEGVHLTKRDRRRLQQAGLAHAIERRDGYFLLAEKNRSCMFLNPQTKSCDIYSVRPTQCRNFPFSPGRDSPIATRSNWEEAKEGCPGIGVGRFYSKRTIRRQSRARSEHGSFEV